MTRQALMSALISARCPLKNMSAAHNLTARGYPQVSRGCAASDPGGGHAITALRSTETARVSTLLLRVHSTGSARRRAMAANLDATIDANFKEFGIGR